jgi:hypothetical protein
MAPALAGQADQRGYESASARIEPRDRFMLAAVA